MNTVTYILPTAFLPAITNDDYDGLSEEGVKAICDFLENENLPDMFDTGEDVGFYTYHDLRPYGVLACDCVEVIFSIGEEDR